MSWRVDIGWGANTFTLTGAVLFISFFLLNQKEGYYFLLYYDFRNLACSFFLVLLLSRWVELGGGRRSFILTMGCWWSA